MKGVLFYFSINHERLLGIWQLIILCIAASLMPLISAEAQNHETFTGLTDEEVMWIKEHPVIRSTNYSNWPPLDFTQNGKPTGFSVEYLKLIASKVGLEIEYVSGDDWPALLQQAKDGEIDMVQSISRSGNRPEYWNFTSPYLKFLVTFYGRIGADTINSANDLIGKKIAVVEGWSSHTFLMKNYRHLDLVVMDSVENALTSLSAGDVDVFIDRAPTSNYIISKNFITGVEIIGQDVFPTSAEIDSLRFAVRKDWPLLLSILEKGMLRVSEQEIDAITNYWQTEYVKEDRIALTSEEVSWLAQNNTILVASDSDLSPLASVDVNGKITGIAGAYLNLISDRLNIQFEWIKNRNRSDGLSAVRDGHADIITSAAYTLEQSEHLNFTDNYLVVAVMIFSVEGGSRYVNMASLRGKRIAQVKNYALTEEVKRDFPDIEIVEVKSDDEALRLLHDGEVDAHLGVIPLNANRIAKLGFDDIIVSGETPYKSVNSFGVRKDLTLLLSAMQKVLNSITPREKAEFSRNWLSLKVEQNLNDLIFDILLMAISVILIVLIWATSLRREINRRKEIEEKLRKSQKEAETANAAKSTFLANMSHEIRTPLNAIIGFSDVISSGVYGSEIQPKYQEYLKDIKRSGEHLAVVINDILDLSKIEAGKWQMSDVDFELLRTVEDCARVYQNELVARRINFSINIPNEDRDLAMLADEGCVKRIVDNLLSNAVKFTADSGAIKCSISKTDDGSVKFETEDTGVGIAPHRLKLVLSPFGQDHELKNLNKGGTGLGLSIVAQLVALHGGTFTITSKVDVGTKAIVIFPKERIID